MTRAFRIGRISGIDIEVDWTWFIVFFILALALSRGLLADRLPDLSLGARWLLALVTTLLFFGSVLAHELAHSLVAVRNGLGITGITLFIFGGVSKLTDEPKSPGVELKVAIAGPATSLGLSVVFLLLAQILKVAPGSSVPVTVFWYLGWANGFLAIFNLLPGFPLDGGRVVRAGLWGGLMNLTEATRVASGLGQGLGVLMIAAGILLFVGALPWNGLMLAFMGWFLIQAAQASYQQLVVRQALSVVPVSSIMTRGVQSVPAGTTLDQVMHEYVMGYNHPAFPVMEGERVVGLLCLADIRGIPRERWGEATAEEAAPALSEQHTIAPGASAWEALVRMTSGDCGRLLVLENGRLLGIISRTDIMRAMRIRFELGV